MDFKSIMEDAEKTRSTVCMYIMLLHVWCIIFIFFSILNLGSKMIDSRFIFRATGSSKKVNMNLRRQNMIR